MALEILSMDLSSTVIGSAVSVVVVVISYVIYKFGIGEKSFEEVLEEQKKQKIEEELKQKSEQKVKKEKKFKKTWAKKSKDRTESEVPPEPVQILETKDDTDIEIIEPKEIKSVKQKNKSKSSQQSSDASSQEKLKKIETPPPEKPSVEKKKIVETEKLSVEPKIEAQKEVEVKETVQSSTTPTSSPIATVSQKKKKKEHVEKQVEIVPMTASKLLSLIKESALEAEEIQNFIDVLLNKQKDSSGWTKKNDTLAVTKKNLLEKEQLLDQEHRQNQAVTSKLKEVREENIALKTRLTAQEKSNAEKISRLQQDLQVLTTKTKNMQDQRTVEREKVALINKESEKKIQESVKNLEDEKAKLLQKISKLETEFRSGISKMDYDTVKKSREDLQKVHTLLVDQHTQLVSKVKNQDAQLSDLKNQIEKLNSQNKALADECNISKEALAAVNSAKITVEDKLKAEEKRSIDLEMQLKQLSSQSTDLLKLQAELKELRQENERLTDQLVTTKERVAGDGQEILHQNGELNGKAQVPEKILNEKDKLLEEKEHSLAQLKEELSNHKAKVALLKEEIEIQKQKNNELREKNWKAMEALTNSEKNAEQKIKEIQQASDQRLAQLEKERTSQTQQKENEPSADILEKLKKAETEAAQNLSNYNVALGKNKQLSSEIVKLNELHEAQIVSLQNNIKELESKISRCQLNTRNSLQKLFPSISVSSSLSFEEWFSEFEKQAVSVSHQDSSVNELLEEKEKELLERKTHYEQMLQETESTLLQLQKSAESQEALWQEKLKTKDLELEEIKSQRDALVSEKEAMQSTFQQISQLEELQEKLKLLQSTLENAENERSHLEQKYEEVNKNCLNLRDQLEVKEKQILELEKQSNKDSLYKEIEDLKSKLELEKKISKDFSSQMIRLNSLVKIGQDALKAEQEMVKKLKAELESAQVSTANGTPSMTVGSPVAVSESHKKTKNPEKSKKRMDASDKK